MTVSAAPFLEYSDSKHRYYADGQDRLSVTQVLNAAGLVSPYSMDEEARWRGSEVHALCAQEDEAGKPLDLRKVDARLRGYIKAWRNYRAQSGFIATAIEQRIDDHENGYAGRFDRLGFRPTRDPLKFQDVILDIKTAKSGSVADYVRYQLVAYAHAHRPNHIYERIAVALMPNGQYRCKVFPMERFAIDRAEWLQILKKVQEEKKNVTGN